MNTKFTGDQAQQTINLEDGAKFLAMYGDHYSLKNLKQLLEDVVLKANIDEYKAHTDLIEEAILAVAAVVGKHQASFRDDERKHAKIENHKHKLDGCAMALNLMQTIPAMLLIAGQIRISFEMADDKFPRAKYDTVEATMREMYILTLHKRIADMCDALAGNTHIASSMFGFEWSKLGQNQP